MINTVKSGAGISDRSPDREPGRQDEGSRYPRKAAKSSGTVPGPDMRLVIERDAEGAYCIYKLIDRATGAVAAVMTREELAAMAQGEGYTAGAVVSTKA